MNSPSSSSISAKRALLTSFGVGITDISLNAVVALFTGSVVMLAQSMQGLADLSSISLVLFGHKRATKSDSKRYPFGHGKELYFWALLAAFFIFTITAGLSLAFGYQAYKNPDPIHNIYLAFAMLTYGGLSNAYAFSINARRLLNGRPLSKIWKAFFDSHDVAPKTTFVLDLMGTLAAVFGLLSLVIYQLSGQTSFDGIGAMIIGVMLGILAIILLLGLKSLVTGRSASPATVRRVKQAALSHPVVEEVLDVKTMIIGPEKILVNIELHFRANLTTNEIEQDIDEIKAAIHEHVPSAYHVQVELETPDRELK